MRLLIAERSPILRKRLTRLFSELGYISLVAFVNELAEVLAIALKEIPDVIVIDLDYPNLTSLQMIAILKDNLDHSKIFVFTETTEPRFIRQFEESGADVVFNKKDDLTKFIGHLNIMDGTEKKHS